MLKLITLLAGFAALVPGLALANEQLVAAALERAKVDVTYDPAYVQIPYPNGDVPGDTGVCTDLVIRAYRAVGIDLQQLVHEDIAAHFDIYPKTWGHRSPDTNIDHRRVPNLETFFKRHGRSLPVSTDPGVYKPGDVVTWRLPSGLPHIGIVSDALVPGTTRPMVVHNIGYGPRLEDTLFEYDLHGHYRYGDQN